MAHEALIKEGKDAVLRKNADPKEVKNYFLKKGLDPKEAEDEAEKIAAAKIVADAKKAEKEQRANAGAENKSNPAANEKKSSFWFYLIILVIIAAVVYYLYSSGKLDLGRYFK